MGCLRASSYLAAGRDLFDGAVLIDCDQTFADFGSFGDYDDLSDKLASRYNHIPIVITTGGLGSDYQLARHHFDRLRAVDIYNNKYLMVGSLIHDYMGVKTLGSEAIGWRFDDANNNEQIVIVPPAVTEDATHLSPIKWLMQQTGLPNEQIPADPYPNESYWDGNVHDSVPNKTNHVYQYLHHNGWAKASA